ncbi:hypothetical protein FPQ18DRAFT_306708 [Pyronema domesticum]|uniref:Uncharacterized protein n=1 Tax=Pyronema omphalodes (strain CBS 100304) TaxID=1076935 RepID=U4LMB5_PYROM|nr:hypothetical protein FPQ18DRAFT_306708 [Pyronema domesticum]CCX33274.1 Protein of unknown function [Pyronema omphalodes CBS 100304]
MARKLTSRPGQTHRVLAPRTNLQQVPAPAIPTKAPRSQPAAHRVTKFPHHQTRITTKAPRNLPSFQHLVANSLANGTANYHGAVKVPPPRRNPGHKARKETQQGQKAPEIRGEPERLFYEPYSTSYKSDSETSEDFGDNEMDEDSEDYDTDDDSVTEGEEYISFYQENNTHPPSDSDINYTSIYNFSGGLDPQRLRFRHETEAFHRQSGRKASSASEAQQVWR